MANKVPNEPVMKVASGVEGGERAVRDALDAQ
jgi:hypothetical protein